VLQKIRKQGFFETRNLVTPAKQREKSFGMRNKRSQRAKAPWQKRAAEKRADPNLPKGWVFHLIPLVQQQIPQFAPSGNKNSHPYQAIMRKPSIIQSARDVYSLMKGIKRYRRETVYSLLLDGENGVMGCEKVSRGSDTGWWTPIPDQVFRSALDRESASP